MPLNELTDATRLLESRARALAKPTESEDAEKGLEVFAFMCAGERLCVPATRVMGTFRLVDLALLPGAPPSVAGVTLWRGQLLTVFDLRPVLGLNTEGLEDRAWVVVMDDDHRTRGFLVGDVLGSEVAGPERAFTTREARSGPVRGVDASGLQLLDVDALLTLGA